nr:putative ribonuclease H-like domain-containing protein [Tanacetum cinerariifolium]
MSYLSDFEELNGGYVAFGGNPKGGKISGKGRIMTVYDKKNSVLFTDTECLVLYPDFKLPDESQVLLRVPRENNMYNVNLKNIVPSGDLTCLFAKATINESNLWHRRLGHVNFKTMNKLVKGNRVRGLPSKVFENDNTCVACKKGKQHRAACKTKSVNSVDQTLYMLYMDLFGPTFVKILNKKSYYLVVTDDYSRFTWVFFLATKDKTCPILKIFITGLENQFSLKVKVIRSGNGTEFKNHDLTQFCGMKGIKREFSNQSNPSAGVQEQFDAKKAGEENVQQYVRFPLWSSGSKNPQNTDDDAAFEGIKHEFEVHVYPSSSAQTKKHDDKTKREAKGKSPTVGDLSAKFEDCSDNSIKEVNATGTIVLTVGQNSRNSTNTFSDIGPSNVVASPTYGKSSFIDASQLPDDPDMPKLEDITYSDDEDDGAEADFNNLETSITVSHIPTTRVHKDHHVSQIIGDMSSTTQTRSMTRVVQDQGGLSHMFNDDFHTCIFACFLSQEEPKRVHQALKDPCFQEKIDERGIMVRNKARLVTQGHTQEEGINYEELFTPEARIEAIRLFLAYVTFMGFMVYQIDVKSAFLYETIKKDVYVFQPPRFEDPDHPDKVYKVVKALYGLHQAPRAWELIFFLGLQVKQKKDGIFICQDKYVAEILRNFGLTEGKLASTPIDTEKPLLKDTDGEDVDVHTYRRLQKVGTSQRIETSDDTVMDDESNQGRMTAKMDQDDAIVLKDDEEEDKEVVDSVKDVEKAKVVESAQDQGWQAKSQAEICKIDMDHANKTLSMQEDKTKPTEVQEEVDVVTIAKLITKIVTAASETVTAARVIITTVEAQVPAATTATLITATDKGKGILVEEPKPLKKKQQIEQDEQYARELHAELNKDIDWDKAINHVKRKAKEDPAVKKYQAMKRKPHTKAQARNNMMMYLKNAAAFKLDYFKGMSYDDICPIFKAKFNSNMAFLLKTKEQIEEDENRALQNINETPAERAAKRRKLDKEVEDLKRHLQIVLNKDDNVYTEATLLARKDHVVDCEIIEINNKPYYKIIRAD